MFLQYPIFYLSIISVFFSSTIEVASLEVRLLLFVSKFSSGGLLFTISLFVFSSVCPVESNLSSSLLASSGNIGSSSSRFSSVTVKLLSPCSKFSSGVSTFSESLERLLSWLISELELFKSHQC